MNKRFLKASLALQSLLLVSPCFAQIRVPESAVKGIARTNLDSPKPTASQVARRNRNNNAIKAMGLHILENLPLIEDQSTIKRRPVD